MVTAEHRPVGRDRGVGLRDPRQHQDVVDGDRWHGSSSAGRRSRPVQAYPQAPTIIERATFRWPRRLAGGPWLRAARPASAGPGPRRSARTCRARPASSGPTGIVAAMMTPIIAPAMFADREVVGVTARSAPAERRRDLLDRPGELVQARARTSGTGHGQLASSRQAAPGPRSRHRGEHLAAAARNAAIGLRSGGWALERLQRQDVEVVLQHDVFLGREVAEERARARPRPPRRSARPWSRRTPARGTAGARAPGWQHASWPSSVRAGRRAGRGRRDVISWWSFCPGRLGHAWLTGRLGAFHRPAGPAASAGAVWRGRNASASSAAASAMAAQHQSITSSPWRRRRAPSAAATPSPSSRATSHAAGHAGVRRARRRRGQPGQGQVALVDRVEHGARARPRRWPRRPGASP